MNAMRRRRRASRPAIGKPAHLVPNHSPVRYALPTPHVYQRASTNVVLFGASCIFGWNQWGVAATIVGRRLSHINNKLEQTDVPAKIWPAVPTPTAAGFRVCCISAHATDRSSRCIHAIIWRRSTIAYLCSAGYVHHGELQHILCHFGPTMTSDIICFPDRNQLPNKLCQYPQRVSTSPTHKRNPML